MQINAISGLFGAASKATMGSAQSEPANSAESRSASTASGQGVMTADFTRMTRNEIRAHADKLYRSGEIDLQDLGRISVACRVFSKPGPNGTFLPLSPAEQAQADNTPMNFLQFTKDKLADLERRGLTTDPKYGYEAWKGIQQLLDTRQGQVTGVNIRV